MYLDLKRDDLKFQQVKPDTWYFTEYLYVYIYKTQVKNDTFCCSFQPAAASRNHKMLVKRLCDCVRAAANSAAPLFHLLPVTFCTWRILHSDVFEHLTTFPLLITLCEPATNRQDTEQEANILRNQWHNDGEKKTPIKFYCIRKRSCQWTESVLLKEHFTQKWANCLFPSM